MNSWPIATLVALVILSGCAAEPVDSEETTSPRTPSPTSLPASQGPTEFAPGIYYGHPVQQGRHELRRADGTTLPTIRFNGVGFDMDRNRLVAVDDDRKVTLFGPRGDSTAIIAQGFFHPARPSLSPDGWFIAVQAMTTPGAPGSPGENFEIFVVNLHDGTSTQISNSPDNDESPEWVPNSQTIVWSSFSPENGIDLHEYWVAEGRENETRNDIGAIHLDVSADGTRILDPGRLLVYQRDNGNLLADLRDEAIEAASKAGFEPDARYPGQANRGTFPLDGAFSPDGLTLVLDGAVKNGSDYGVILMTMGVDGTGWNVIGAMKSYDPAWTNDHNFSNLNPLWLD